MAENRSVYVAGLLREVLRERDAVLIKGLMLLDADQRALLDRCLRQASGREEGR